MGDVRPPIFLPNLFMYISFLAFVCWPKVQVGCCVTALSHSSAVLLIRIGFSADQDLYPAFYLDEDSDPDPESQTNADLDPYPDPNQT
jgi:hypothetical protein